MAKKRSVGLCLLNGSLGAIAVVSLMVNCAFLIYYTQHMSAVSEDGYGSKSAAHNATNRNSNNHINSSNHNNSSNNNYINNNKNSNNNNIDNNSHNGIKPNRNSHASLKNRSLVISDFLSYDRFVAEYVGNRRLADLILATRSGTAVVAQVALLGGLYSASTTVLDAFGTYAAVTMVVDGFVNYLAFSEQWVVCSNERSIPASAIASGAGGNGGGNGGERHGNRAAGERSIVSPGGGGSHPLLSTPAAAGAAKMSSSYVDLSYGCGPQRLDYEGYRLASHGLKFVLLYVLLYRLLAVASMNAATLALVWLLNRCLSKQEISAVVSRILSGRQQDPVVSGSVRQAHAAGAAPAASPPPSSPSPSAVAAASSPRLPQPSPPPPPPPPPQPQPSAGPPPRDTQPQFGSTASLPVI